MKAWARERQDESYAWAQVRAASLLSWRHLGCFDAIPQPGAGFGTWSDSFVRVVNASLLGHRPQELPGVTGPGAELPPRSEGMGPRCAA